MVRFTRDKLHECGRALNGSYHRTIQQNVKKKHVTNQAARKKQPKARQKLSSSFQEWQITYRRNCQRSTCLPVAIGRHQLYLWQKRLFSSRVCVPICLIFATLFFCILVYFFEDSFLLIIFDCKCQNCHVVLTVDFQPTYTSKILIPYSCCTVYIYIYILH